MKYFHLLFIVFLFFLSEKALNCSEGGGSKSYLEKVLGPNPTYKLALMIKKNHATCCKSILVYCIDNSKLKEFNAFFCAAKKRCNDWSQDFQKDFLDVPLFSHKRTLVHHIVLSNKAEFISLLLNEGVSLNSAQDSFGRKPCDYKVSSKFKKTVIGSKQEAPVHFTYNSKQSKNKMRKMKRHAGRKNA